MGQDPEVVGIQGKKSNGEKKTGACKEVAGGVPEAAIQALGWTGPERTTFKHLFLQVIRDLGSDSRK